VPGGTARSYGRTMTMMLKTTRVVGAVLALAVVAYALTYLRPGMPSGFADQLHVYRSRQLWFLLHIGGGAVALALAPSSCGRVGGRGCRTPRTARSCAAFTG